MKISIITATYNSENTLIDTLKSVESQNYKDIEYIVIDGGSTDNTLELIKKHSTRVSVLISERDNGIYDALNKGICHATGDVIGFLHSDDIFSDSNVVTTLAQTFKNESSDIVFGDLVFVNRDNTNKIRRYWKSGAFDKRKIKFGWVPPHPSFYMKKEQYMQNGFFDLSFKIAADYDQMLRCLLRKNINITYLPSTLVKMRLGGESTRLDNAIQSTKEITAVMRKHHINWRVAIVYRKISKLVQLILK